MEQVSRYILPILEWANSNKQAEPEQAMRLSVQKKSKCPEVGEKPDFKVPIEFNSRDYLAMLLQIDAEIEHGLMVQYLYAAYSLGGRQVPVKYREKVAKWQEIILGIAKEEMGHFISVQNVLKLIGAPLDFRRSSFPWDTPFYPFPFKLEQLTLDSLAKYVYAEAPCVWLESSDPTAKEIVKKVTGSVSDPHTVGALFEVILNLISNQQEIPDEVFQPKTLPYQAKFEEWGRGYVAGERGNTKQGEFRHNPDVLVAPLLSRDDAFNALQQIAEQGEGDAQPISAPPSHFKRFLFVYEEMREALKDQANWSPSRNVASNPTLPSAGTLCEDSDLISNPEAILWAELFNLRYRMLLNYLNHSFLLDQGYNNASTHTARGMIINSTFGEMYNLRSISMVLVQTPLTKAADGRMAGPPFLLPYTLDLPFGEHNRWRLHTDLLMASGKIIASLKNIADPSHLKYLDALSELDSQLISNINRLTAIP